eukprot:UN23339
MSSSLPACGSTYLFGAKIAGAWVCVPIVLPSLEREPPDTPIFGKVTGFSEIFYQILARKILFLPPKKSILESFFVRRGYKNSKSMNLIFCKLETKKIKK